MLWFVLNLEDLQCPMYVDVQPSLTMLDPQSTPTRMTLRV